MSTTATPAQAAAEPAPLLYAKLAAPFPPAAIGWKPQVVKGNRAMACAYIDARDVQNRLDEAVGPENWWADYQILGKGEMVICRLTLLVGGRAVTKTDVGGESDQPDGGDRLKAAFSDSLKRAAVQWGVGRYLYYLPSVWCDFDPAAKQITRPPQLPDWALPARGGSTPDPRPKAITAPAQPVQQKENATPPNLPATGGELLARVTAYDDKLAAAKRISRGALVAHVVGAGVKAGYPANVADWTGPAIPFAVEAVKEFEAGLKPVQKYPELGDAMVAARWDWPACVRWLKVTYPQAGYADGLTPETLAPERLAHLVRHLNTLSVRGKGA